MFVIDQGIFGHVYKVTVNGVDSNVITWGGVNISLTPAYYQLALESGQ